MKLTEQQRKFGNFLEATLDDGTTLTSLEYTDRISLATALRELALQLLRPAMGPNPPEKLDSTDEVLQK